MTPVQAALIRVVHIPFSLLHILYRYAEEPVTVGDIFLERFAEFIQHVAFLNGVRPVCFAEYDLYIETIGHMIRYGDFMGAQDLLRSLGGIINHNFVSVGPV